MNFDKYNEEIKCQIEDHDQKGVFGICFNKSCKKKICLKCLLTIHHQHIQDCIHFDYFESLLKEEINQLEKLASQLSQENHDQNLTIQGLVKFIKQKIEITKTAQIQISQQAFLDGQLTSSMFFVVHSEQHLKQFIMGCTENKQKKQLIVLIEQTLQTYDQNVRVKELTAKGDSLRELFQYNEAIQCYEKAIELNPEIVTLFLYKGLCLHMIDQINQARECFNFVLEIEPQNTLGLKLLREMNESQEDTDVFQLPQQFQQKTYSDQVRQLMQQILNLMQSQSDQLIQTCKLHKDSYWNNYIVLTFMGTALFINQKFEECLQFIEQAIKIYPFYRKAVVVKVRALIELKLIDKANETLYRYPSKITEKENIEIQSRKLVLMGNYEEAAVQFQNLLSQSKNPIEYSMNLLTQGRLLANQKKPNEALLFYREAEKIQPCNPCLHVEIGICLQMLKNYDEAIISCENAIAQDFSFQKAWLLKGQVLLGQALLLETKEVCETYLAMCPNDKELEDLLSLTLSYMGCTKDAKNNNDINPEDAEQLIIQGVQLLRNKQYNEAVKEFNKVLTIKPQYIDVLIAKSFCLIQLKQHLDALGIIDNNILTVDENQVQCLQQKGVCLFHLNLFEEAFKVFSKVQQLDPQYTEISLYCAHCLLKMGKVQEAQNIYQEILQQLKSPFKYTFYAYYYVKSLFYQGQHIQAMEFINKIALQQQKCKNPQLLVIQIMILRQLNDFQGAFMVANALIPFFKYYIQDFSIIYFIKGDLLQSLNQYEQAIQAFDEFLNKRTLWIALVAKGNCLSNLNQHYQAEFHYNKAIENFGSVWTPQQQERALLDEIEKLEEPLKCWPRNNLSADQFRILGSLIPL